MSEIKVDKLQGTSGSDTAITLSGANATVGGTLAVTGVHTIGNNAIYTSDGSAVTQNTVQSLLKGWMRFKGDGTISIDDSFNYASIADNGTGDYTTTLSNAMSNRFYSPTAGAGDVNYGAKIDLEHSDINTTTAMRLRTASGVGAVGDTDLIATQIAGDLA